MPALNTDVSVIAPEGDARAAGMADWLNSRGVAYLRVLSVPGSSLVLRVGDHTLWGAVDKITQRLRALLWRDLQTT
jgi:hypothetical protein